MLEDLNVKILELRARGKLRLKLRMDGFEELSEPGRTVDW